MKEFFILLMALTLFHFIYDGIIAPSLRFDLRFRLFTLRDELRAAKIKHREEIDEEAFCFLQNTINNTIKHINLASLKVYFSARHLTPDDEKFMERVDKLEEKIDSCPITTVKDIRDKHTWLIGYAFLINSGGWA